MYEYILDILYNINRIQINDQLSHCNEKEINGKIVRSGARIMDRLCLSDHPQSGIWIFICLLTRSWMGLKTQL